MEGVSMNLSKDLKYNVKSPRKKFQARDFPLLSPRT